MSQKPSEGGIISNEKLISFDINKNSSEFIPNLEVLKKLNIVFLNKKILPDETWFLVLIINIKQKFVFTCLLRETSSASAFLRTDSA
jgi:hypothetical protein